MASCAGMFMDSVGVMNVFLSLAAVRAQGQCSI